MTGPRRFERQTAAAVFVRPRARRSPDGRGVLYSAGAPQLVEPARNGEPRFRPEIAVEHLPVIADRADDVGGPGVGEPHLFAEAPRRPDEAHDFGLLRLQGLPDGFRADAELLAVEHSEMDPSYDLDPLEIALPHDGPERLFRDHVRQDHVIARFRKAQAHGVKLRQVA